MHASSASSTEADTLSQLHLLRTIINLLVASTAILAIAISVTPTSLALLALGLDVGFPIFHLRFLARNSLLSFRQLCRPDLLQLSGLHHLTLEIAFLLRHDHGHDHVHAFLVIHKDLALLLIWRFRDTCGDDSIELRHFQFRLCVPLVGGKLRFCRALLYCFVRLHWRRFLAGLF